MTDVSEFMRVYLRGLNCIEPITENPAENLERFEALLDVALASLEHAARFGGNQTDRTFTKLLKVARQAERLWPLYQHAADELGE